jgi:hypothetical protein
MRLNLRVEEHHEGHDSSKYRKMNYGCRWITFINHSCITKAARGWYTDSVYAGGTRNERLSTLKQQVKTFLSFGLYDVLFTMALEHVFWPLATSINVCIKHNHIFSRSTHYNTSRGLGCPKIGCDFLHLREFHFQWLCESLFHLPLTLLFLATLVLAWRTQGVRISLQACRLRPGRSGQSARPGSPRLYEYVQTSSTFYIYNP